MTGAELDEAYERVHRTGPEFQGWLANHGPMTADALVRLGRPDQVSPWVNRYLAGMDVLPVQRWPIAEATWRDPLGDPSRLGDWLAFFATELAEQDWQSVLHRWWPRLLPGAIAAATHGIIRTGHAVRALAETVTPARSAELGQALGYWAARWQPLPGSRNGDQTGRLPVGLALDSLPFGQTTASWGNRGRLAQLTELAQWPDAVAAHSLTGDVPGALDKLVDAAVTRYGSWAEADPVMLVHAATAPRAAALVLPSLPTSLWHQTYRTAWTVTAAITSIYASAGSASTSSAATTSAATTSAATTRAATTSASPERRARAGSIAAEDLIDRAVAHADPHVIKFVEVALQSHARGNDNALPSALRAVELIPVGG